MNTLTRKNILLIEPAYPNKYPPLGLMKLAAYHGPYGRNDHVTFLKGPQQQHVLQHWDRIYVTTLFSFEWQRTAVAIDFALRAAQGNPSRVFVGGIAASLMHEQFTSEPRWHGIRFIKGLLDAAPAHALQLSSPTDFGADDIMGQPIEEEVPDYSILDQTTYQYPVSNAYFGYASRGCVRKCSFCGVPKLEGAQRDMPPLTNLINGVSKRYGEKKDLVLMDNNITASARYQEIISEIADLGFQAGATIKLDGRRTSKRRVDFNQGVDARILCKSPMFLREMSRICISPLRIAFDHIGVRKPYETSVRMATDNGITNLSNYMLYNFMDSPGDLYQRMLLNIQLNEELGIRIWSFPMRYQPVDLKHRSHVGKNWNRYYLRSFQIMLQATRGIITGNPAFFEYAYGSNQEQFQELLSQPHHFLFHRSHYLTGPGQAQRDEYQDIRARMSPSQQEQMINLLAGPADILQYTEKRIVALANDHTVDPLIRAALRHHVAPRRTTVPDSFNPDERQIPLALLLDETPPPDEIVEDAGLYEPEPIANTITKHIDLLPA